MHAVQCFARVPCRHGLWQVSPKTIYEVKKAALLRNLENPLLLYSPLGSTDSALPQVVRMTSTTAASGDPLPPWYAGYPAPKLEAATISREDVLLMLRDGKNIAGKDFVFVDLRRNDHEVHRPSRLFAPAITGYPRIGLRADALLLGRDNSRIHQPARSEPLAHHSHLVRNV